MPARRVQPVARVASASTDRGLLAPTDHEASGQPVNGIRCEAHEQAVFHIHAHVAVFVNSAPRAIPEGIEIPAPQRTRDTAESPFVTGGTCFYWLHSHTRDGVSHLESPIRRIYTLGDYFAVWKQPLGRNQVGPARGPVTAYVDGKRHAGDPARIPLKTHTLVQLDMGSDVPPQPYVSRAGL